MAGKYGPLNKNHKRRDSNFTFSGITIGNVVDTNDPQQMGRLRIACPTLGDVGYKAVKDIPWATYASPLAGVDSVSTRGRAKDVSIGPVSYGMWSIPNVGSSVLVACIDGDTKHRVWLGCVHGQFLTHTMPHGRYVDGVDGPSTSEEQPINPLSASQAAAFQSNFTAPEYATRGSDGQVSAIDNEIINSEDSEISATADSGRAGYRISRNDPTARYGSTGYNKEALIHSWTTPGFHSLSMDDSDDNCRIRIRTTHGAQIILDDSNERIYVSTANGKSWIELDEAGNIDVYAEKRISMHSKQDFNIQSDAAVRITGKQGVHIHSDTELRMTSKGDSHIQVGGILHLNTTAAMKVTAESMAILTTTTFDVTATTSFNLFGAAGNLKSSGPLSLSGTPLNLNGTLASSPTVVPVVADTSDAWLSMRVPDHEPWPRVVMTDAADGDSGNTQTPQFGSGDASVGKVERDETITRNINWKR